MRAQSWPTPGSSLHGVLQARILEWVAISSSGDLPDSGVKSVSPAIWRGSRSSPFPYGFGNKLLRL